MIMPICQIMREKTRQSTRITRTRRNGSGATIKEHDNDDIRLVNSVSHGVWMDGRLDGWVSGWHAMHNA
jgi:hypothetical protein